MRKREMYRVLSTIRRVVDACIELLADQSATNHIASDKNIDRFIGEQVLPAAGESLPAYEILAGFRKWWADHCPGMPIPSQKRLGMRLRITGHQKAKRGGRVRYLNIALRDQRRVRPTDFGRDSNEALGATNECKGAGSRKPESCGVQRSLF